MDACVAMAAHLCVVEPMSTGLGGDAFMLYYDSSKMHVSSINGSGRTPRAATFDHVAGISSLIPETSALSVTVPGGVALWLDAFVQ